MLPKLPNPLGPLRDILKEGRQRVEEVKDDIHSLASELHGSSSPVPSIEPPPLEESPVETNPIAEGTACNICSSEHFTQVAGDLAEAVRFAQDEGLTHPEAIRRITHARAELNAMERYDLSSSEIEKLTPAEKEIAQWGLTKSRNIRHLINQVITNHELGDLRKATAEAERTAEEFTAKVLKLPAEVCEPCLDLRGFLERRLRAREEARKGEE